jgi:hypothetical protein
MVLVYMEKWIEFRKEKTVAFVYYWYIKNTSWRCKRNVNVFQLFIIIQKTFLINYFIIIINEGLLK